MMPLELHPFPPNIDFDDTDSRQSTVPERNNGAQGYIGHVDNLLSSVSNFAVPKIRTDLKSEKMEP